MDEMRGQDDPELRHRHESDQVGDAVLESHVPDAAGAPLPALEWRAPCYYGTCEAGCPAACHDGYVVRRHAVHVHVPVGALRCDRRDLPRTPKGDEEPL